MIQKILVECKIPAFILVDADPHGIEIMLTYRFGSCALAHTADQLASPDIVWLGVRPSDALLFNLDHEPLTKNDLQKMQNILKRSYIPSDIRNEISVLKIHNRKAEIEAFYKFSPSYLVDEFLRSMIKLSDAGGIV